MPYSTIIYRKEDHVARITLNRAGADNVLTLEMVQEMTEACHQVVQDADIYVVIITGAGKAFCTGGGLRQERQFNPAAAIAAVDRPVIAAINGDALGEGLELALSADIRLASSGARFGLPQLEQGLMPMNGGTQRLPRIVGKGKALEMLLTTGTITAGEALEIGLVDRVVAPQVLAAEAGTLARTMASKGPIALRYIKEAVNKGMDLTLEQGLRLEADLYFLLHTTADRTEGIRSFLEKRPPEFKGE